MNLPPEEVPHEHKFTSDDFLRHPVNDWLKKRGLYMVGMNIAGTLPLDELLCALSTHYPGLNLLLSGTSRNNVNHTVIACDSVIVWDPSLDDSGIVGPCDDGHWWVNFIGRRT